MARAKYRQLNASLYRLILQALNFFSQHAPDQEAWISGSAQTPPYHLQDFLIIKRLNYKIDSAELGAFGNSLILSDGADHNHGGLGIDRPNFF